ncbi:RNA polymerase subunit sigma-70 [Clostridium sp. HV4-5-A1G]|jgi:RNA polymerase sigma-70 factor (ECF subfamily)|nr:sigma factor [Clostridium sp. HV4-5-A1G]KAA8680195.1 RNA polymerase subunit sigma-70 [Clostridium sp. HV4-5-A1G]
MNIEELVVKAKNRDENAFCELIKMNKETLYKTAYFYTKNKHDSLEILDDTVYKAYISIKKLKQGKYFNTWIMRILINSAINYINKRKRFIFFDKNIDGTKKHESFNNREEILDLYNAIDTLEGIW